MCRLTRSCSLQGKGALRLAIETAERSGANLILANDPDADRLAAAERQAVSGPLLAATSSPSSGCRAEGSRTALARMHIARKPESPKAVLHSAAIQGCSTVHCAGRDMARLQGVLTGYSQGVLGVLTSTHCAGRDMARLQGVLTEYSQGVLWVLTSTHCAGRDMARLQGE